MSPQTSANAQGAKAQGGRRRQSPQNSKPVLDRVHHAILKQHIKDIQQRQGNNFVKDPVATPPKQVGTASPGPLSTKSVLRLAPPEVLTADELLRFQQKYGNQVALQVVGQRIDQVAQNQPIDLRAPVDVVVNNPSQSTDNRHTANPGLEASTMATPSTPAPPIKKKEDPSGTTNGTEEDNAVTGSYSEVANGTGTEEDNAVTGSYSEVANGTGTEEDNAVTGSYSEDAEVGSNTAASPRPLKTDQGYRELLERQERYKHEFERGTVDIPAILENFKKRGADAADGMKRGFGWSDADCQRYLPKADLAGTEVTGVEGPATAEGRGPMAVDDRPLVHEVGEAEREQYELHGGDPLTQGPTKEPFDTSQAFSKWMKEGWCIFVMDSSGRLFAAQHKVGLFHHSSFLAGGAVAGAGELKAKDGTLKAISNKSGHYTPGAKEAIQVLDELQVRGIKLETLDFYYFTGSTPNGKVPDPWRGGAKEFYDDFKDHPERAPT